MKVGDLVAKTVCNNPQLIGVVIKSIHHSWGNSEWVQVNWGAYGILWSKLKDIEVISESR
tara:strand:+ start:1368 stop:1547 length:180 start_codon:yes stop_codon:yes gene_type:complete